MKEYIVIHQKDNVAVALTALDNGHKVPGFTLAEEIQAGHKFALRNIAAGEAVVKYGNPIGYATEDIGAGALVHTHNIKTGLGRKLEYVYQPDLQARDFKAGMRLEIPVFMGFRRADGKVGIRNELWIIPTVGCVNNVASAVEKLSQDLLLQYPAIDAIAAFPHPYGCSQMGEDQDNSRRILADLVNHPNAGGILVLGLGCENSNIEELKKYIGTYDEARVKFLVAQECGDEIEESLILLKELAKFAGAQKREEIPGSELVIGMKCGGSDGLSGITANPVVGAFSDLIIKDGGTTILTEVPEMFGAETILMNRCTNQEIFKKTVDLVQGFKEYFKSHNQTIYENPSPGNKKGGISTLEDKSLGCIQKSGFSPVVDVLAYGEPVSKHGLNLLSAPGNDLVASTALAASGAHIILFTTGRGTPFASPVPTMKISSNTSLYQKKNRWIDFNAGSLLEGNTLEALAEELYSKVLLVACGAKVKSETAGFHDFAIFKQGVTL